MLEAHTAAVVVEVDPLTSLVDLGDNLDASSAGVAGVLSQLAQEDQAVLTVSLRLTQGASMEIVILHESSDRDERCSASSVSYSRR